MQFYKNPNYKTIGHPYFLQKKELKPEMGQGLLILKM